MCAALLGAHVRARGAAGPSHHSPVREPTLPSMKHSLHSMKRSRYSVKCPLHCMEWRVAFHEISQRGPGAQVQCRRARRGGGHGAPAQVQPKSNAFTLYPGTKQTAKYLIWAGHNRNQMHCASLPVHFVPGMEFCLLSRTRCTRNTAVCV